MSYPVRPPSRQSGVREILAGIEAMQIRVNRLIGDAITGHRGQTPSWHPDIDVEGSDSGWVVVARLPGVAPDEVDIDVNSHDLIIRSAYAGSRQPAAGLPLGYPHRPGDFFYRIVMPGAFDSDGIEAVMEHGLLVLRVPRASAAHTRRIPVARRIEQSTEPDLPA
jgi:HSP20 family protein